MINDDFTFNDVILTISGFNIDTNNPDSLYCELIYNEFLESLGRIIYKTKGEINIDYYKGLCDSLINKILHNNE